VNLFHLHDSIAWYIGVLYHLDKNGHRQFETDLEIANLVGAQHNTMLQNLGT